jgi:CRP/FNR family transcriptional regulator, anaerobic regulatory protein
MYAFIDFLHSRSPLSGFTKQLLTEYIEVSYHHPHSFLRKQGDISDKIFFIRKGLVHLYRIKEKTDWLACENHVICPFNRFLKQEQSSVLYETIEPTEVQTINYSTYTKLLKLEDFRNAVYQVMIDHLCRVSKFHAENTGNSAKKFEEFINHFPGITNRVPVKIIASFLDVCSKTITRIRSGNRYVSCLNNSDNVKMITESLIQRNINKAS